MEYKDAINEGFELFDEIDTEFREFKQQGNRNLNVLYNEEERSISVDATWDKDVSFKVQIKITAEEVAKLALKENVNPKEALGRLLKEKVSVSVKIS